MGCKDGDGLGKYQQGKTTNMRAHHGSGIMRLADKVRSKDSGGQVRWHTCGTTGMDTAVEEMRDRNTRDVR